MIEYFNGLPGWYFTGLIGLIGGFFGLCWYAIRGYFNASKEFRNIIYTELEGLYPTPTKWPSPSRDIIPILKEKHSRIERAVDNFKGHLFIGMRNGFAAAWQQYHGDYDKYKPGISTSSNVNGKQVTVDTTDTYKDIFKHNVDNLLKYAKTT